eukprot:GHVN01067753.1.p1 GENE.GHVN01067753.1~~GHVN01067753.1.p1  ORF type:complete len:177 (+),score=36.20 GHVN01067753.1:77-607(+)
MESEFEEEEAPLRRLVSVGSVVAALSLLMVGAVAIVVVAIWSRFEYKNWKKRKERRQKKERDLRQLFPDESIIPSDWSVETTETLPQDVGNSFFEQNWAEKPPEPSNPTMMDKIMRKMKPPTPKAFDQTPKEKKSTKQVWEAKQEREGKQREEGATPPSPQSDVENSPPNGSAAAV